MMPQVHLAIILIKIIAPPNKSMPLCSLVVLCKKCEKKFAFSNNNAEKYPIMLSCKFDELLKKI